MDKKEAMLCARVSQATYTSSCQVNNFRLTARFENKGTDTQGIFGEAYGNSFLITHCAILFAIKF